jgi:hypothetical protein
MFNSLVIVVDGVKFVYECHSYKKAAEILADQYAISTAIDSFNLV